MPDEPNPGPPAGHSPLSVPPVAGTVSPPDPGSAPPAALVEFQRSLAVLTPRVYVTPALILTNVLVFVLMVASGLSPTGPAAPDMLRWGANFGPSTVAGEWWRLLTCTFLHFGVLHLAFNMWALTGAGPLVERMVGNVGFLLTYLVAGLGGSLASLFWNPTLISAGASGAVFGVYGALLGLLLRQHGSVPREALVQLRGSGLAFLGYNLVFGLTVPNIDTAAHLGGLVAGFLGGVVLSQPFTPDALAGRAARNLAVSGLGALVVVGGMTGVLTKHGDLARLRPDRVEQGNVEVSYSEGATEAEAERLAAYAAKNWGAANNRMSLQVRKAADGYQVRLVIKKEYRNDERALKRLESDGSRISRDVFDGAAVELHACDEQFRTTKVLPPRADIRYGVVAGNAEVFFSADVPREDARRLAGYLAGMLADAPGKVTFKLARRGAAVELHMVVRQELLGDPSFLAGLRGDLEEIAANVFRGAPVELHLCDDGLNVVRVLRP